MRTFIFCIALMLSVSVVWGQDFDTIDPNDQVYHFLEYAWAAGRIRYLPQERPYSRATIVRLLEETLATRPKPDDKMGLWIADNAEAHLSRLTDARRELHRFEFDRGGYIASDAIIELGLDSSLTRFEDTIVDGIGSVGVSIGLNDTIFLGFDLTPTLAYWAWYEKPYPLYGEPVLSDYYHYSYPIESGDGTFGHGGYHELGAKEIRLLFDTLNRFALDLDYVQLYTGRDALDWGPGHTANLLFSKTAKPYDHLALRFPLGDSGSFSWMTGILQDFAYDGDHSLDERLVTAHRLEYQVADWLYLSIYESVVYDFTFELAYLNPLAIYYVTEVTQGTDDNKLGGADAVVLLPFSKLYVSFFADDWDAGRLFAFNNSHNEWAGIFGAQYFGLYPGLSMLLEYTYLSHWMYTHYTWQGLSSTGKSYQHYGSHLGHYLDPNSHMLFFESRYDYDGFRWVALSFWFSQNGRGDINTPPNWGAESDLYGVDDYRDIYYTFLDKGMPGFAIDTTLDWSLSGSYTFPDIGLTLDGRYSIQYSLSHDTDTAALIAGSEDVQHFLSLGLSWSPSF